MRVVLDTNVFVSAIFFTGPPYQISNAWRDGTLRLVISHEIFTEYQNVGETLNQRFPAIDLGAILGLVTIMAEICPITSLPEPVARIPMMTSFWPVPLPVSAR